MMYRGSPFPPAVSQLFPRERTCRFLHDSLAHSQNEHSVSTAVDLTGQQVAIASLDVMWLKQSIP